jgi:GH15 family glucan-1,4-alpha-glucosidase
VRATDRVDGYLPLAAYALIGDCRSAALVGHDGSIDWLCLPRFDDASVFGRLLDAEKGGHWQIVPRGPYDVVQRYSDRSNVLTTTFTTRTGRVIVVDFMPLHRDPEHHGNSPVTHPRIVRLVECLTGEVAMRHELVPAPDYARATMSFRCEDGVYHGDSDSLHVCVRATCALTGPRQVIEMREGDRLAFALTVNDRSRCESLEWTADRAIRMARETREFWWRWVGGVRYDGPYQEPVWRSALALKLMTYAPTGAIIAAPTTSLPESVGGVRNWDYRFTWLRDASFTLFAFFQLGLTEEAHSFFQWLTSLHVGAAGGVDNLYTIDGRRDGHETTLDNLDGYRGSRPVRIGNRAARQLQLDVYGELLDSAYLYARFGGDISRELWEELRAVVELAIARWEEPDASIWEVRGEDQHFTYSKVMCWTAVDRGLRIAERYGLPHDSDRWRSARRAIHRRVVTQAWSEKRQAFAQALGSDVLDAAVLRMSQVRFLDDHDPRIASTVDAIARELREGILVRRYRPRDTDDGLHGDEGAFLMCSFWLVDAYAHLGRLEDAQRLFERLLTFQSWCGLFSEECDGRTGELLGNYPQAFTHLALVGAAVNMERLRHRQIGPHGLRKKAATPKRA